MDKTDCFAYKPNRSIYGKCAALCICDCEECVFYKTFEQNEKERFESKIKAKAKGYYYATPYYEPKG